MKTIAVSGTTGFVGKRLVEYNQNRYTIAPLLLREKKISELNLRNIDAVVHLAGKAHDMGQVEERTYFSINYELTKELADLAKSHGVPHFIYISSVKVYGDDVQSILDEQSQCNPTDAYGASKLKAEQYLQSIQSENFSVAIVRPSLVYGAEVKGNMLKLLKLANRKKPLPFGNIKNERTMVYNDNLIELINAITDSRATGIFIAGDAKPLSTTELITLIRQKMGIKSKMLSIPGFARAIIKKLKPALYKRLFGSFVIDNTGTNKSLHFTPPYTTEQGIEVMASWYKKNHSGI